MKDPRNPQKWTNEEIAGDAAGYVAAQEAFREDEARARALEAEQMDRERFVEAFVAGGGARSGAEAAWRAARDQRASEVAQQADQTARRVQLGAARGVL